MNLFDAAKAATSILQLGSIAANAAGVIVDSLSSKEEVTDANKAKRLADKKIAADNKSKGGLSDTKKRIGANDYRKGGYVLSTVDNRKMKNG
jgi:hypothetical protein|tara:strand:+ start:341 stop:616 length:276 start_codon:yes stop_codon:yes gene_type:complete